MMEKIEKVENIENIGTIENALPYDPFALLPAGYERWADSIAREAELTRQNEALQEAVESLQVAQEDLMLMRVVLEDERLRYQQLFEFATDGYLVTDLNGILIEANNAGLARLGLVHQHVKGKILANFIAFDERIRFRAFLNRLPQSNERLEWEGRILPRHAAAVDVTLTACRMRDAGGGTDTLRWIARDITERTRLEQARQADQQSLLEQERRAGVLEERNRIAQEFHDTLAQGFTGIAFLLGAAESALDDDTQWRGVRYSGPGAWPRTASPRPAARSAPCERRHWKAEGCASPWPN